MNEHTQAHNDFFKSEILQLEKEQAEDLKGEVLNWWQEHEPMSEDEYFNKLAIKYEG